MAGVVAEVKSIVLHCADAVDGSSFGPGDPTHFGVYADIFIGEVGSDPADAFEVLVCSPSWFAAAFGAGRLDGHGLVGMPEGVEVGAGFWFMASWDRECFEAAVRFVCESASPGPDWGTVADRIGRQLPWEFAYRFDNHVDRRFGEPFPPTSSTD